MSPFDELRVTVKGGSSFQLAFWSCCLSSRTGNPVILSLSKDGLSPKLAADGKQHQGDDTRANQMLNGNQKPGEIGWSF